MQMKTANMSKSTSPEIIKWSGTYACGINMIDDQHVGLIEIVNDMFSNVCGDDKKEYNYFCIVIKDLVKYVNNHFADEERILNATKFPGFDEHKNLHRMFTAKIAQIIKEYKPGSRQHNLSSIARFLKEWILSHIAIVDKQYFEYFRKIATRKEDGRLSITKADILQSR